MGHRLGAIGAYSYRHLAEKGEAFDAKMKMLPVVMKHFHPAAQVVISYIIMAYTVTAYIVTAYVVMA